VTARLSLALDPGEVRAIVPTSRLTDGVRATLDAAGPWPAVTVAATTAFDAGGAAELTASLDLAARPARYSSGARFRDLDPGRPWTGSCVRASRDAGGCAAEVSASRSRSRITSPSGPRRSPDGRSRRQASMDAVAPTFNHTRARVVGSAGAVEVRAGRPPAHPSPIASRVASIAGSSRSRAPGAGLADGALHGRRSGTGATDRRARLRATVSRAVLRGVPLTGGVVEMQLDGEALRLVGANVDGPELHATASGTADLGRRTVDLGVSGTADLTRLGVPFGQPAAGTVALTATARGRSMRSPWQARPSSKRHAMPPSGRSTHTSRSIWRAWVGCYPRPCAAQCEPGPVRRALPHELVADVDWRRSEGTDRASLTATARADDGTADRLALAGARSATRTAVELRELVWTPPEGPAWRLAGPAAVVVADDVTTPGVILVAGAQRVAIAGRVALRGSSDATVSVTRLALGPLCALEEGPRCRGELTAHAALTGTAERPALQASLRTENFRVDEVDYGNLHLDALYADRKAALRGALRHPQAGELTFDGVVPVDLAWAGPHQDVTDEALSLNLRAEQLDLAVVRVLAPGQVRDAAGRVSLDVSITGRRSAPQATGRIALDDGRLALAATGVTYEELRARGNATGTTLDVTELHARSGGGALDGAGRITFLSGGETSLDLTLHPHEFLAVVRPALEAAVSGDVLVRGNLARRR